MTAIVGSDGSGKTTFFRLICGLMDADGGELEVFGEDAKQNKENIQRYLSYMPQKFGLYEDLTIAENMELYADLHGVAKEIRAERFAKLLDMAGLTKFTERLAGKLSGGMKQKLGLICALVRSPKLLLLDEPTVGVDPLSRRDLWAILKELVKEEGLTVLVNTSYIDEAELCDKVYILNYGKVLAKGSPEELRRKTEGMVYRIILPEDKKSGLIGSALLEDEDKIADAVPDGGTVRFILKKGASLSELKVYKIFGELDTVPVPSRLEDSFMFILSEDADKEEKLSVKTDFSKIGEESDEKIIEVRELVKKFGDFTAVDHTTFDVKKGRIFGLLGPNGAGKTTTFRMLCGLLSVSGGEAIVAGMNMRTARTQARANLGYVAQKFSLYGDLTVEENLRFFGGAYGLYDEKLDERIKAVREKFGLDKYLHTQAELIPGGYKQRLSMAVGLIHEPRILFLDEPTSGIDPPARRVFWQQITSLASQGTTIVITTHFMDEAEYCDEMMIQDAGKMIALGAPREILKSMNAKTMNEAFIAIVEAGRAKGGEQK